MTAFLSLVLLGIPLLCMGGALFHPCDCGVSVSCEHETTCSQDPCSSFLQLKTSSGSSTPGATILAVRPLGPTAACVVDPTPAAETTSRTLLRVNLPVCPSDLPLLV